MDRTPLERTDPRLLVAYQVTTQMMTNESQLVWQRTSAFLFFNTILIGGLVALWQAFQSHPTDQSLALVPLFELVTSFVAGLFCLGWYSSMRRNWDYHDFYLRLMNEQEKQIGIAYIAPANRGEPLAMGKESEVNGEPMKFDRLGRRFKARVVEILMSIIIAIGYLGVFTVAFLKLTGH